MALREPTDDADLDSIQARLERLTGQRYSLGSLNTDHSIIVFDPDTDGMIRFVLDEGVWWMQQVWGTPLEMITLIFKMADALIARGRGAMQIRGNISKLPLSVQRRIVRKFNPPRRHTRQGRTYVEMTANEIAAVAR